MCSAGKEITKEERANRLGSSSATCGWFFLEFCPGSDMCSIVFCINIAPLQRNAE
jgi:hypothetical protein